MKKALKIAGGIVAGIVVISIIAAVAGGGSKKPSVAASEAVSEPIAQTAPAATPAPAPRPSAMTDKGWTVVKGSVLLKPDFTKDFSGTARIINQNDSSETGSFTFTVFQGSRQIGTLSGNASDVQPGQTVTVDLWSTDDYAAGSRVLFQTDYSF